jgi:hypothetical protein
MVGLLSSGHLDPRQRAAERPSLGD